VRFEGVGEAQRSIVWASQEGREQAFWHAVEEGLTSPGAGWRDATEPGLPADPVAEGGDPRDRRVQPDELVEDACAGARTTHDEEGLIDGKRLGRVCHEI